MNGEPRIRQTAREFCSRIFAHSEAGTAKELNESPTSNWAASDHRRDLAGWATDHWPVGRAIQKTRHDARELGFRLEKLESAVWG